MKWMLPVAVIVVMALAVFDYIAGSNGPAEVIAQAVGPYVMG